MSLLGFMASGAAKSYRDVKNKETEQENVIRASIFAAEVQDAFQQRVEARRNTRDDTVARRGVEAEQALHDRNRPLAVEDRDAKFANDRETAEATNKAAMERTKLTQAGANERAAARQTGANDRAALARQGSGSGSKGEKDDRRTRMDKLAAKDLEIQKELHELGKRNQDSEYAKSLRQTAKGYQKEYKELGSSLLRDTTGSSVVHPENLRKILEGK